uniref:Uncharacterized protein n=1 Tax=Oryza meridionalis TaxID=40149 RepID=A0A0E0F661_9ORYZ
MAHLTSALSHPHAATSARSARPALGPPHAAPRDPDLDAAKVSLGAISYMATILALQLLFKRSVAFVNRNDSDIAEMVAMWGGLHEFGDVASLPRRRMVVYREHGRAADHAGFLDAIDPLLNLFFFLLNHPHTNQRFTSIGEFSKL